MSIDATQKAAAASKIAPTQSKAAGVVTAANSSVVGNVFDEKISEAIPPKEKDKEELAIVTDLGDLDVDADLVKPDYERAVKTSEQTFQV